MSKPKPLLAFVAALVRRSMAVGSGLLSCCLLVAPPLAAGASAPLSPRDLTIVGGQWTWAGGSNRAAEGHLYGVYGTKGGGAPGNAPGARRGSVSWTDAAGSFWLFGGQGYAEATFGSLNDLWKWDGTSWTWVSGSKAADQNGVYGTKGVGAPGNVPGSREGSVSWTDASGNLWLFGGNRYFGDGFGPYLNDLWKWDGTNWTWVSGSNAIDQGSVFGEMGVPAPGNVPGARANAVSWIDASGNLWLFGGEMHDCDPWGYCYGGYFNDLWRWDGTNWAWMGGSPVWSAYGTYGTKGVAAPENVPGGRAQSVSWKDASGSLWLFGGVGVSAAEWGGDLNDLWKWDGTNWTWVSGSDALDQPGTYGTKGVPDPTNVPGAREGSVSWTDPAGNFWLSGGSGFNDLWKWDGANWTWVSGSESWGQAGTYGTKGVAAPGNVPGARRGSVPWRDASGNLWLFGGAGKTGVGESNLNDLWKWDGTNWTWVSGSNGDARTANYGTKGVPAPGNVPGARSDSTSSRSPSGALWLFGGQGYDGSGSLNQSQSVYDSTAYFSLNDLWRWDGTTWTWVSGSNVPNQFGIYGTKGVPAPANVPGARHGSVSWTDPSGSFWLFGGAGYDWHAQFNDLWKWDGTNWTWMSGSDAPNQHGTYGTKGVPAPENVPGARIDATSWTDGNGNFWLFGGYGWDMGYGNDLWKWDGTNWTWMSGSSTPYSLQCGTYGTKGVPAPGNVPGGRSGAVSWTDSVGNLWLFGGSGYGCSGSGNFNDLWKWDGTNWTWMSGADDANDPGSYGTKGVAVPTNTPRARAGAVTWTDSTGNLWLFGGEDARYGGPPSYNDLWKWDGTNWTWISGSAGENQLGTYGTKGVAAPGNVPGARFESIPWTDTSGNLWLFGGDGFDSVGVSGTLNDLWVFGTTCTAVAPPTAGNLGPFPTGWTIRLTASTVEGATYLWTGPNGFTSAVQNPTIPNATMAKAGDYSVSLIVGGCSSGTSTTTVVVVPGTGQSLSVSKDGAGAGTVSSQPAGIDCGDVCSEGFPGGSLVTLTATPAAGSRFAGWVGEGCFGSGPCTLTMDATRHVSASFLSSAGARFFPLAPCRVVDTRSGTSPWSGPALAAGAARAFEMTGRCGVPVGASAVAVNVTVTNPTTGGSFALYPGTGLTPPTDTVFFAAGKTRANNATVGLVGGLLSIANRQESGTVDVIIDVSGYYR